MMILEAAHGLRKGHGGSQQLRRRPDYTRCEAMVKPEVGHIDWTNSPLLFTSEFEGENAFVSSARKVRGLRYARVVAIRNPPSRAQQCASTILLAKSS